MKIKKRTIKNNFPLRTSLERQKELDFTGLFSNCKQKKYKLDECLFSPLNVSNKIYFVTSGKVKTTYFSQTGRAIGLNYYKNGDLINLETITEKNNRKTIALSKSKHTTALIISKHIFLEKLNLAPELQKYVLGKLLVDKTNAENRISKFLDIPSHQRVYDFLYHHLLRFGEQIGYEYVIRDPLTHQEISEYVGCSRQTVTTSMNDLRREGIIDFNRKYWIIRNLEGLKNLVHQF